MAGKKTTEKPAEKPAEEAQILQPPRPDEDGAISLADFDRMSLLERQEFCYEHFGRMYGGATVDGSRVFL